MSKIELTKQQIKNFNKKIGKKNKDGCISWNGAHNNHGYPVFRVNDKLMKVSRIIWGMENEELTDQKIFVCHKCDNVGCINKDHFFLGTHQDNMSDMLQKARQARGVKNAKAKLTDEEIKEIRKIYNTSEIIQEDLAEEYGVRQGLISLIVNKKVWTHIK